MNYNSVYEEMLRNLAGGSFQSQAANYVSQGMAQPPPPAPTKEAWLRATVAGFISHLSVNGWQVSRRAMTGGVVFTWRSARGQQVETKILGQDRERQLIHACGLLAGWSPELRYWTAAFKEVDVPTSGRS